METAIVGLAGVVIGVAASLFTAWKSNQWARDRDHLADARQMRDKRFERLQAGYLEWMSLLASFRPILEYPDQPFYREMVSRRWNERVIEASLTASDFIMLEPQAQEVRCKIIGLLPNLMSFLEAEQAGSISCDEATHRRSELYGEIDELEIAMRAHLKQLEQPI